MTKKIFLTIFILISFVCVVNLTAKRPVTRQTKTLSKSRSHSSTSLPTLLPNITLRTPDISMKFLGELKEDYFLYYGVRTLRDDYFDQNNFVRHKLSLNWQVEQGRQKYNKPATQAGVKLANYVYWQQHGAYLPFSKVDIRAQDLNDAIVARDVTVKTLIPLIFAEEAWAKVNFDTFLNFFKDNPTFLQVGYFNYIVGRGVSLGYHDDMAVDYLGWPGENNYQKYSNMPPGILLKSYIKDNLSLDLYFMKWRAVGASLSDTLNPTRAQRLDTGGVERGCNKDTENYVLKLDYTPKNTKFGDVCLEPYYIYTRAPEQTVELIGDSASYLHTIGAMGDFNYNNFNVNIECAGQVGYQELFPIDRNEILLDSSGTPVFSHIVFENPRTSSRSGYQKVPTFGNITGAEHPEGYYSPSNDLKYIVNLPINRAIEKSVIKDNTGAVLKISKQGAKDVNGYKILNSDDFGNARFRNGYKLNFQGLMLLADVSYNFPKHPFKAGGSVGYISGDAYPYNEERTRNFGAFIPLRSQYRGHAVKNTLIFDRLDLPRPLNISYKNMYAYNCLNDLSNLQFFGFSTTWYPLSLRKKCSLTSDILFFWEVGKLYKWDKKGHHSDSNIEKQIGFARARLGFEGVQREFREDDQVPGNAQYSNNSGWLSDQHASRMLGTEWDITALYNPIDNLTASAKMCLFFPGQLYKDLEGQPNVTTQRIDHQGLSHYDSLGHRVVLAFVLGLNYKF